MRKLILLFVLSIIFGNYVLAYDFSAVCSTGQTLYYNITSDVEPYTVEVTSENADGFYTTYPTGDLEIPETVEYNSITYSVTRIGDKAFRGCSELTSVNIPDIVTNIGYSAFDGCGSLTGSLIIPDLVTDIGNSAFSDCTRLTSLTLGNSVIYIGNSAFSGCSGLTSVTIPNSVNTIFSEAFYGCDGLISVNYNGDIEGWCNISFDEYGNPVSYAHNLYINNELLTNLIIPETITRIKAYLFTGDTCITSLTIPNSITSIGKYAFDSCSALTSITMGTGIESIGENAFRNTGWYNNQPDGVLYLDNGWCLGYKSNEPTGDLVLEEGTKGIVREAFSNCSGITSVTIPSSVEYISGWSFNGLDEITLNFNATNCTFMGGDEDNPVFINTTITTLNIGENVRTIPDYAFYTCGGLTSVTIPNSVNRIGEEAFYFASELTDITLGTGIKHIGRRAFESTVWYDNQSEGILYLDDWCLGYKGDSPTGELTIAEGTLGIADAAFNNCEITSVTIPNSVTSIGGSAFAGCTSLASITIGTGVTHIGLYAFYNTEWYNSQAASILYLDNWCIGYKGEGNMTIENLVIQDGTIGIASYAFFDGGENTSIKSVTIPNSVFNIGEFAFAFCTGITDLTIGSNVNIEDEAFRFCENITSIQIFSNTPPTLGNDVFPETAYNTATVWVPIGSGGMYRNNSQWRQFANIRELPYFWSCDFEGSEIWTFGNDSQGNVQWQIVTPETYPAGLVSGDNAYIKPFVFNGDTLSNTPYHWAMVDIISQLTDLGGPGQVAENPYIEFSGIDLSDAEHPQLRFNQIYRRLNTVETLIRVSSNGGQTWVDHTINSEVESNEYGKYYYTKDGIDIFEAAGAQNVVIRFYMISEATTAQEGYGWEIDDIQIVEAPQCDLTLQDARISMFGYLDYRDEEAVSQQFPNMENPREYAYQLYDPYAQSPRMQWYSSAPSAAFNVEVSSYGYDTVTPMARVKITNPNGVEIYNKETSGIRALSTNDGDTVDFFNSDAFYFEGIESYSDIIIGRYTVDFYVYADGMDDDDESDNHTTQYFYITDNIFSMSYDEPTGYTDFNRYTVSSSGDEYGISFTYSYQPERNIVVEAYIDEHTTVGTMAQAIIYEFGGDGLPIEVGSSNMLEITSDMLGSWVNFPLNDHVNSDTTFMVAIRGIWNDGETFAVGSSDELTSKGHNCYMRLLNQNDSWCYAAPQLAIRVRESSEITDSTVHWSCDFEEGSPQPSITGSNDSEANWEIITESDYPESMFTTEGGCYFLPMNYTGHPGNNDPHQQISETPEHWAYVNACSDDYTSAPQINTSMTFSNIDLSASSHPKITFKQSWRLLNPSYETISVETSIDGGMTWTSHVINDEQLDSRVYVNGYKEVGIMEAAGASNVAIRFNYTTNDSWNYGWQIDDIKIKETPAYDLAIHNARISMFGYTDYRDADAVAQTPTSQTAYQRYDPYAQSPRKQWQTENGFAAFNVEVANNGYETIIPMARITITNPNGEEIYNKLVSGNRSLSFTEIDTLDFADENLFRFENDILTGRYNVDFYVFAEGMEVVDSTNQYFDITEKTFSTSYNEPTAYRILDHTNSYEEWYGVRFTYYYENFIQNIENGNVAIEVFIDEHTSVGSTIYARLYEYDNTYVESFDGNYNDYQEAVNFDGIEIDEDMLGTWINLDVGEHLSELIYNNINREVPYSFIIAIHPEENETLAIGTSDVLTSMGNNSVKMTDNGWHPIDYQLAIRVREISEIADSTVHWSCDFEGDEIWTFGNEEQDGNVQWQIVTPETYPETLVTSEGAYLKPFVYQGDTLCDTPEHWAMVDLISQHVQLGGPGQVMEKPYIEFRDINLSNAEHPEICIKQIYRRINNVETIIKVSTDGGATWTDHVVNADVPTSNEYGEYYIFKGIPIFEAAGQRNVTIRFQMNGDERVLNGAVQGYGWEIDDIVIKETPANDLALKDARISMFGYTDYRDEDLLSQLYPGYDSTEVREYAYQSHDPYAQSPRKQWATENGYAAFNVEVSSYGYDTVIPMARVKITNPNGVEICNKVSSGIRALSTNKSDTVDFFNSASFYFEGIESYEDIIIGRYTVDFYVFADDMDDADESDNHTTQYFDITDNTFSMSYDEPTGYSDFNRYTVSSSGDEYGISFTYSYQPERKITVDAYIDEHTTVGTMAQAIIYEYNGDIYPSVEVGCSDTLVITSDMLGSWVSFHLNYHVNSDSTFFVAIRGIWNDGETFAVGTSDVLTSKGHMCYMRLQSQGDSWYYAAPQLAIRLRDSMEADIVVLSNNDAYGSVSGGGTYNIGDTIMLMAMPNGGYLFDSWEDDNAENPRTITVTSDSTFIADFIKCEITQAIDTVVPNFVTIGDHTFYSTGRYSFEIQHEADCDTIFDINLTVLAEPEPFDIEPNPTKSIVNIHSDKFISFVEFYSTTGQFVMRKEVNGNFIECDVESLVSGIYIVRIYGEDNNLPSVYKIVKE